MLTHVMQLIVSLQMACAYYKQSAPNSVKIHGIHEREGIQNKTVYGLY